MNGHWNNPPEAEKLPDNPRFLFEANSNCTELVGRRVIINVGAWKGESGTVVSAIPEISACRVRLDSGFATAWFTSELDLF